MATNPAAYTSLTGPALLAEPPAIPADGTYLAWSYDPAMISTATVVPTLGSLILTKIQVRFTLTVTNAVAYVIAGGTTLTAGQNFIGLYSAQNVGSFTAGGLIAGTADQSANWAGAFTTPVPFTGGPYVLPAGGYWLALLVNAAASPTFARSCNIAAVIANSGVAAAQSRYGGALTAQTVLPASFTPSGITPQGVGWWMALS